VKINRMNTNGTLGQTINVPITYGPKEKVFVRLRQDPNLDNQTLLTLPIFSFEITSYTYDTQRAPNRNQKIVCHNTDGTAAGVFMPVPYNLSISLYLLTKGTEDGLDVLEQLLPLFMPEYTATIQAIPSMNLTQDVPFNLNSVSASDDFEGEFQGKRLVTHTLDFTAKINLYGGTGNANIITRTDTLVKNIDGTELFGTHVSEGDPETGEIITDIWS
jgi:hypothetical protein